MGAGIGQLADQEQSTVRGKRNAVGGASGAAAPAGSETDTAKRHCHRAEAKK
jgi:hypothetical protein